MRQNSLMTLPSASGSLAAPTLTTRTSVCSSAVDFRMPGLRILSACSHGGYLTGLTDMLRIMQLSPIESDEVIFETSSNLEPENSTPQKLKMPPAPLSQPQRKRNKDPASYPRNSKKSSAPRHRGMVMAQLTPPLTLASRRNTSKNTTTKDGGAVSVVVDNTDDVFTRAAEVTRTSAPRKAFVAVAKRRPKRPLVSLCQPFCKPHS